MELPTPALITYEAGGDPVQMRVGDRELMAPLRLLFPAYETSAAAVAPGTPVVTVDLSDRGWVVSEAGGRHACRTVIEVAEAVEFALTHSFLRHRPTVAQVHAAAAVFPHGAMLLLGGEGAGKTSLTFRLSRTGYPVLGDDVTLVAEGGVARAFKRLFKVDPAVLLEAGVPPESTRLWEPGAATAWYDPTDGGGWADAAPLAAVGVLRRRVAGPAETRPIGRPAALNALMHSLLSTGLQGAAAFEVLAEAVRDAATFEFEFVTAADGIDALTALRP